MIIASQGSPLESEATVRFIDLVDPRDPQVADLIHRIDETHVLSVATTIRIDGKLYQPWFIAVVPCVFAFTYEAGNRVDEILVVTYDSDGWVLARFSTMLGDGWLFHNRHCESRLSYVLKQVREVQAQHASRCAPVET